MFSLALLVLCSTLLRTGLCSTMPFGCPGQSVTDRTRVDTLDFINYIRMQVVFGQYEKYGISKASDMNKMRWDCNLEAIAERAVQNCPEHAPLSSVTNAMNFNYFAPGMPQEILKNPIETASWEWLQIRDVVWPADNIFDGNSKLRAFANMIRANSVAVGCYSATCKDRASSACVFSQPEIQVGTVVYTSGNPCKNGEKCMYSKRGSCENGLCVIDE